MPKKGKSLSAGVVINVIALVLVRGLVIVLAPYMTKVLTTEEYGVISIFNTWSSVVTVIAGMGATVGLNNFRISSDKRDYHRYCLSSLLVGSAPHLFFLLVAYILRSQLSVLLHLGSEYPPLIVISAYASFIVSFLGAYLIIENEAITNFFVSFLSFGLYFGLSYVFVEYVPKSICSNDMAFALGNILSNGVIAIAAIVFFVLKGWGTIKKEYVVFCLKLGIPMVFHSLATLVISSSDRVMLQRMKSESVAGIYTFTYSFASIIGYIRSAIHSIWVPFYYRMLKDKDYSTLWKRRKNFDYLFGCLFAGFILVYSEIMPLFSSSKEYLEYSDLIIVIALAFVGNHIYSFPTNYEIYKEKNAYVAVGTIGAGVCNVILNLLLIPAHGALGAAIATLVSYFALALFHWIIAAKVLDGYPMKKYRSWALICITGSATFIAIFFKSNWIVRWAFATAVGAILVARVWKNKSII